MNKIRQCRELKQMSQKFVAVSVGVSAPMVSQWESGIKKPSKENIVKLANLFGVTTDFLLDHDSNSADQNYTVEEQHLILIFRQLNTQGRKAVSSLAEKLIQDSDFRQEGYSPLAK